MRPSLENGPLDYSGPNMHWKTESGQSAQEARLPARESDILI
jgi:hypothetical protein